MVIPIKIPSVGTTVEEVTLLGWLRNEGDEIKRGDILCVIETDKATAELESVAEGILLKRIVPSGTEVKEGAIIAWVGDEGEEIPEETPIEPLKEDDPEQYERDKAPPVRGHAADKKKVPPLIRNMAKKLGVDLENVIGTGPGGRITKEDVQRAKESAGR